MYKNNKIIIDAKSLPQSVFETATSWLEDITSAYKENLIRGKGVRNILNSRKPLIIITSNHITCRVSYVCIVLSQVKDLSVVFSDREIMQISGHQTPNYLKLSTQSHVCIRQVQSTLVE